LADVFFAEGHTDGRAELLDVAVDDATLVTYCAKLELFVDWQTDTGGPPLTGADVYDRRLAEFFSKLCFDDDKLPHEAATTLSAVLHFRPELHGHLPRAARALKAYRKLVRTPERATMSRRSLGAVIAALLLQGKVTTAVIVAYSFDIVGRGTQDWILVRANDVHLPHQEQEPIGITLGRSDRGERTKTGFDAGVVVKDTMVKAWIRSRVRLLRRAGRPDAKVFDMKPQHYRAEWLATLVALHLPRETPHIIRHTAATELWATARPQLTLRELMVAGRWASESSVRRYTKPHLLAAHESIAQADVLELGAAFWADTLGYMQRGRVAAADRGPLADRGPSPGADPLSGKVVRPMSGAKYRPGHSRN